MDTSWNANQFAHMESGSAGNALLADAPGCSSLVRPQGVERRGVLGELAGSKSSRVRPDVFPADLLCRPPLLDSGDSGDATVERVEGWWLVHTLPRQEKALANALYARDIAYYLPLVTRKSLSRGRTRVAQVTLFPGYVFVCGTEDDRLGVLKTNRVLTVRPAPDGERLRQDLRRFFELISTGAPLLPEARLVAGERVRVKAGPFRDQEGIVIRRNGKTRLLIAIDYLQQGASLEVDDCLLERV